MKFYSAINQAITLAGVDYGDRTYRYAKYDDLDIGIKGRSVQGRLSLLYLMDSVQRLENPERLPVQSQVLNLFFQISFDVCFGVSEDE